MAEAEVQSEEENKEKVKESDEKVKSEDTEDKKQFDLKNWKTWAIIIFVLIAICTGIYFLF